MDAMVIEKNVCCKKKKCKGKMQKHPPYQGTYGKQGGH